MEESIRPLKQWKKQLIEGNLSKRDSPYKEVFAVFIEEDPLVCYSHIGQHSECTQAYIDMCTPATREQAKDLIEELESIDYDLDIVEDKPYIIGIDLGEGNSKSVYKDESGNIIIK